MRGKPQSVLLAMLEQRRHLERAASVAVHARQREYSDALARFEALQCAMRVSEFRFLDASSNGVLQAASERRAELAAAKDAALAAARRRQAVEALYDRRCAALRAERRRAEARDLDDANARSRPA